MQKVSAAFLSTLSGSHHPVWRADAWYGGRLTAQGLQLKSASVTVTRASQVRAELTAVITDEDGSLAPRSSGAVLAARGQEIHVTAGVQTAEGTEELVSLGWFKIRAAKWVTRYGLYTRPGEIDPVTKRSAQYWVDRPSVVTVTAADRMRVIERGRFVGREQPVGTVFSELGRIARDRLVGWAQPPIGDRGVPAAMTYDDDALGAVTKLAGVVDAVPVMTPEGSLTLLPNTPGTQVWSVPALAGGLRVSLDGEMTDEDIHNVAVERGKAPDGSILQWVAQETTGFFAATGPFGQVPFFHQSDFLDTQAQVIAGSATLLATITQGRTLAIVVQAVSNPAVQVGDVIGIPGPNGTVGGVLDRVTWTAGAATMTMTVLVDAELFLSVIT